MNPNIKGSNRAVLAATIDPDNYAPAAYTSDWVSLADYLSVSALVLWGTLGGGATINAKLQQATDSAGTGAKDITGKAITEIDASDSPIPNDKQAVINCRADELDVANSFTHVALVITVASTASPLEASDVAGVVLGFDAKYQPEDDLASVAEVV